MTKICSLARKAYFPLSFFFLLVLCTPALQATKHIIQFGGVLGEVYQPQNLTTGIGDTIQWQGSFTSHPLSSTIIPSGAAAFHATSGSVFSYVVTQPGTYNYKCDFHAGNGMTGSFSTVFSKHVILFGDALGLVYSPNSLTAGVGDTIRWQGDFSMHPLSSTTIPSGASGWHTGSGSAFDYIIRMPGIYNYRCDFHFSSGMVGSFTAIPLLAAPNLVSPASSSTGNPVTPLMKWNSVSGALRYDIQISTATSFSSIIQEDSTVTDTTKQLSTLTNGTTYFWRVRAMDNTGSSSWSDVRSFTTIPFPPLAPILLSPSTGAVNQPLSLVLRWQHIAGADSYRVQLSTDSIFSGGLISDQFTADTTTSLSGLSLNTIYFWRVNSQVSGLVSEWSSFSRFTTVIDTFYCREVALQQGWNLISIPLTIPDWPKSVLFPFAVSNAFMFNSGYISQDTLNPGLGYWLKVPNDTVICLAGTNVTVDTIDIVEGWNLIGSINSTVTTLDLVSIPGGIITSNFFYYNHGYFVATAIEPGKGYWVKASQAGKLILESTLLNASNRITVIPNGDLPPSPPEEVESNAARIPVGFGLQQNFPNPFNPSTVIDYQLPENGFVSLKVYSVPGKEVATLVDGFESAGYKSATFNASDLPSGVYYYRLQAGTFSSVKKMILMK